MNVSLNIEEIIKSKLPFDMNEVPEFHRNQATLKNYLLLSYLSDFFTGGLFIEGGTKHGRSARCLAHNGNNMVITYDIYPWAVDFDAIMKYDNIQFRLYDINKENTDVFGKADLIFLDVDPHDGIQEEIFLKKIDNIFKGILIMDDIFSTDGMKNTWDNISYDKYALPEDFATSSGVGVVNMSKDICIKD